MDDTRETRETRDTMNLDLNLGPVEHPNVVINEEDGTFSMSLEDWLNGPVHIITEAFRQSNAARRAGQRWRSDWNHSPTNHDTHNVAAGSAGGGLETGEGSVAVEARPVELTKTCENPNGVLSGELGDNKDDEKLGGDDGSFFDCNICLDLAKDPVVTCCGHLFCWPCIYKWLHVHSEAKECPICKGEVSIKNVTPIYGRGNTTVNSDEDPNLKIPHRPQARRVESWRQTIQRNAFTLPIEEMIRRLGNRFDLTRDLAHIHPAPDGSRPLPERSNVLLNRILTSRGMHREQNQNTPVPPDDVVDLTATSPTNSDAGEMRTRRHSSLLQRLSPSHRAAANTANTSHLADWSPAERIVESYFHIERGNDQIPILGGFEDRDSVSSIAAIIQSESQTVDTAVEIDSTVSHSTSSSRRIYDGNRVSDVDSGDSRPYRRRRLNNNSNPN